jgi:50S ribosomal subunit-associated GTPase HflX
VLNKIDRLPAGEGDIETIRRRLLGGVEHHSDARAAGVSALTGEGVDTLLGLIDAVLPFDLVVRARFRIPVGDGGNIHLLHEFGRVMRTDSEDDHFIIEAEVSQSLKDRLAEYCV